MGNDNFNLFYVLLKLKSYLVSMLDSPENCYDSFYYTEEYLDRKLPERKDEILYILNQNGITNDCDIAFNEKIIVRFREMAKAEEAHTDLSRMLNDLEIQARDLDFKNKEKYKSEREKLLHVVLETLLQLATNWSMHEALEEKIDDYAVLDEEEVLRPDEERNLSLLDSSNSLSYSTISGLTKKYLELLINYFFKFGGDLSLKIFVDDLDVIRKKIDTNYDELFKNNGLDPDQLR